MRRKRPVRGPGERHKKRLLLIRWTSLYKGSYRRTGEALSEAAQAHVRAPAPFDHPTPNPILVATMTDLSLFSAVLLLGFANGANDNFKGFATAVGAQVFRYRHAKTLATLATFAGALSAIALGKQLAERFAGSGLVPADVLATDSFRLSVVLAGAGAVGLATCLGLPVSTTHALLGSLVGTALAHHQSFNAGVLGGIFLAPMLLSPLLAAGLGVLLSKLLSRAHLSRACLCVVAPTLEAQPFRGVLVQRWVPPLVLAASAGTCERHYPVAQVSITQHLNGLHLLSALAVCFARAANDLPKVLGVLYASHSLPSAPAIAAVGLAMASGSLFWGGRVASTMSYRIAPLDSRTGFAANAVTSALVIAASAMSLPVSATHVAVAAIAGAGGSQERLHVRTFSEVLLAWFATFPVGAALALMLTPLTTYAAR